MYEQMLNGFSSIQFLKTTYARHVGLLRGGFCVFDVINTICYRILVNKDFHSTICSIHRSQYPAIYSCIFHSCIFNAHDKSFIFSFITRGTRERGTEN